MQLLCGALVFSVVVLPALATNDLAATYNFQQTLYDGDQPSGSYVLHWSFNSSAKTISFAVNVSTTGWVGFGISPNGQMPGSDVVIGWVDSQGNTQFHDRFADDRVLPSVDESQDWELLNAEEENGFTVLEFERRFVTCDDRDLDIGFDTTRVIWSWNTQDPAEFGDPLQHTVRGTTSLNLLGGLENSPTDPDDVDFFDFTLSNVLIPSDRDTSYWCASFEFPTEIQSQERYITRFSPALTNHEREYAHHVLIYLCPYDLEPNMVGESGHCDPGEAVSVSGTVSGCQQGLLIAAWAVGGEDFIYPENVAYPVGGENAARFAVLQMHYDNPDLDEDVVDSSGLRFFYTSTPREHRGGILFLGHAVNQFMLVPPNANNYTIAGLCHQDCTQSFLPEGGIKIFGNLLHTHLVGRGLTLQHFRWNAECSVWEELSPIDQNLRYDFNYQQFTHLAQEVTVLPGDLLILKCIYNTMENDQVTLGGESTREEMCLSFPVYYPQARLDRCLSIPEVPAGFQSFIDNYIVTNPSALALAVQGDLEGALNNLTWDTETINQLQNSVTTGSQASFCTAINPTDFLERRNLPGLPSVDQCSYEAPDTCSVTDQLSCCDRVGAGAPSIFSFMNIFSLIVLGVLASTF